MNAHRQEHINELLVLAGQHLLLLCRQKRNYFFYRRYVQVIVKPARANKPTRETLPCIFHKWGSIYTFEGLDSG